jgi:hypothetical protein
MAGFNFGNLFPRDIKDSITDKNTLFSFNEWILDNGTLTSKGSAVQNSTSTAYTVPSGKILYVTAATFSWMYNADQSHSGYMSMGGHRIFNISHQFPGDVEKTGDNAVSFPVPLKLVEDDTIVVSSDNADLDVDGRAIGYIVDA